MKSHPFPILLTLILSLLLPTLTMADDENGTDKEKRTGSTFLKVMPYRPSYFLYTYNWNPNNEPWKLHDPNSRDLDYDETKFQLSFKFPLFENIGKVPIALYVAYTQISLWQTFRNDSAPFRDTNYEPEIFTTYAPYWPLFLDLKLSGFTAGFVHQSNGQGLGPLSRSWNRVYTSVGVERPDLKVDLKAWYRFPEHNDDDDNKNIEKYYGYGELRAAYKLISDNKWLNDQVFSMMWRNNLRTTGNKGAIELGWSMPIRCLNGMRGYVQYFNGYGESLLDYDHPNARVGAGVMINDWF